MPDRGENNDAQVRNFKRLVDAGAEITGNLAGSAVSYFMGGPIGALAGGAFSPVLRHMLGLATDVIERGISKSETKRIGATLTFAAAKVRERLDRGEKVREDGFFEEEANNRAAADEIAEGVILVAQREHEEKKLKFYGALLANLAFTPGIDRGYSNLLLRLGDQLSYRQLCLLVLFTLKDSIEGPGLRKKDFRTEVGQKVTVSTPAMAILYEVFDLYSRGLVSGGASALLGLLDINPAQMTVQGAGPVLFQLMELYTVDMTDVNCLIAPLS